MVLFTYNYPCLIVEDPPDVKLSKFLSYICRHGAEKEGLQISDGSKLTVGREASHDSI